MGWGDGGKAEGNSSLSSTGAGTGQATTFLSGREKLSRRYYRPRVLGTGAARGEARRPVEPQPVSPHPHLHPARKAEGHSVIREESLPLFAGGERAFGALSPPGPPGALGRQTEPPDGG